MARYEPLNNVSHKNLQVHPYFAKELGDNVASVVTFITEFAEVQKEYPILIKRDAESGETYAVALLGLQKDENLFLTEPDPSRQPNPGWDGNHIPAVVARGAFSIGLSKNEGAAEEPQAPVINVDMDNPKICQEGGIPLFLAQGGKSAYLERIDSVLNIIRDGMSLNKPMFDAFDKYGLVEPLTLSVDLNNGDKFEISGFYTINSEVLSSLSGDALRELNRSGFFQAACFILASLSNVKRLVALKNAQTLRGSR